MLNLVPRYRAGRLDLKPTTGKGTLAFVKGSAALKLSLTPFFQGDPGPPGPSGAGYVHSEPLPASVWTVNHNLGFWPNVYVLDTNGDECEGDVDNVSQTSLTITFSAPFAGIARLT